MPFLAKASTFAPLVLRLGLAAVILWFGGSQVLNPEAWTVWVPEWATGLGLEPITIVYLNGVFELVTGVLLVIGLFLPYVAFLLFLHMVVLVLEIGVTPIGVRDFGLAMAFLALAMFSYKRPETTIQ